MIKKIFLTALSIAILLIHNTAFALNTDKFVMGYWSDWNIYSMGRAIPEPAYALPGSTDDQGKMVINKDLQEKLNLINAVAYSFLEVNPQGSVYFADPNSDLRLSSDKDTQTFCTENSDICNNKNGGADYGRGNFNLGFVKLKNDSGNLRKIISIGGYGHDDSFNNAFANPDNFVHSVATLVNHFNLDGVDLDYEASALTSENVKSYVDLIAKLRDALGPNKLITMAIMSGPDWINSFGTANWQKVAANVNYIDLMTYDFHGAFDNPKITGLLANLYPDKDAQQFSVDVAVNTLIGQGVPSGKVVIGVPAYGRALTGVNEANHGLYQSYANGLIPRGDLDAPACTQTVYGGTCSGSFQYKYIIGKMLGGPAGFTDYTNDAGTSAQTPSGVWAYRSGNWTDTVGNTLNNTFISYDNILTVAAKAQYVKENNLGGIMMWELRGDISPKDPSNASLLGAITHVLG